MTVIEIMPIFVAIVVIIMAILILRSDGNPEIGLWKVPAVICGLFGAWTLGAMVTEGLLSFWPEHIRNMWGNQIWFDLLISICVGWFLLAPKARALDMRLPLWLFLIICTGSFGMTAMLSRCLYLQERRALTT